MRDGAAAETLTLPAGGRARLLAPYLSPGRLWVARARPPHRLHAYLHAHGAPIRYAHEPDAAPARGPPDDLRHRPRQRGDAERRPPVHQARADRACASAGSACSGSSCTAGVSSQERGERPYPERYEVSRHTADRVNARAKPRDRRRHDRRARAGDRRPTSTAPSHASHGWTDLTVTPERGVRAVDGLLTGWHEPEASHLLMLEAFAGRELLERSYAAAVEHGYRWHEFGDLHLLLR